VLWLLVCPLVCLADVGPPAEVGTGPQPAPLPVSWELEFKFLDPRRIEVQVEPGRPPEVYWYLAYTVTNRSDRSQMFFPTFQLVTQDLRVLDTDMGISPLVFEAIRERHRQTHKYLRHPTSAIGELLCGDDNARESVAVWRDVDLSVNEFKVYVAGLSGEARLVPNPAYDPGRPETVTDEQGRTHLTNPKHFTLRKTLEIRYNLLGSPTARATATPERAGVRWVMR